MRRLVAVTGLVSAALVLVSCGDDTSGTPSVSVDAATIPDPAGANAALYLELVNQGDGGDRLVEVRTDIADDVQLHRTTEGDDGLMRMEPVDGIEIGGGDRVSLEPGGLHAMLIGVDPVEEGDTVEVDLVFEESGTVTVDAVVGSLAEQGH